MKKNLIVTALTIACIVTLALTNFFISEELFSYVIITITMFILLAYTTISFLVKTRSEEALYTNYLKRIIKTYDAILVESNTLPSIKDKNIVKVSNLDDLIDAQIEVKKPIYYNKFQDYAVFILVDNLEALVTIVKKSDNVTCQYETELQQILKRKQMKDLDKNILEQIDKTTILKLGENKSFKISPIRVDNVQQKEFTPKRYHFRKNNIYAILNDETEVRIMLKDVKDIIKTQDSEKNLTKITIKTSDGKTYILKEIADIKLNEVEEKLMSKIAKINNDFEAKVECQTD